MAEKEQPKNSGHEDDSGEHSLGPRAKGIVRKHGGGGSQSFLVGASDDQEYWCKALNNPQSSLVPVVEQAVGRLGSLIGVAVCEVQLIEIPPALAGEEFAPNIQLEEGWVHGSLAVTKAIETRELEHRNETDNASRHAGFFALYDWLLGADDQWLRDANQAYFSHDHGGYLLGGNWAGLAAQTDQPHPLVRSTDDLDSAEAERLADVLDELSEEEIAAAIRTHAEWPEDWPFSEDDRRCVIEFAASRAPGTAERIRASLR